MDANFLKTVHVNRGHGISAVQNKKMSFDKNQKKNRPGILRVTHQKSRKKRNYPVGAAAL